MAEEELEQWHERPRVEPWRETDLMGLTQELEHLDEG
jgi:hypothetical protein